ncbi:LGFP repeat-containing protein [Corynebacterium zhongnanshanii]|nr:hypothetical protein [Corynebacterium zhongnanshanii]
MRPVMKFLSLVFAAGTVLATVPASQAQDMKDESTLVGDMLGELEGVDTTVTAPDREGLVPGEAGFGDNVIDNHAGAGWVPTVDPKSRVVVGGMRSDREEVPGGFSKEQADRAEVQEAAERWGVRFRGVGQDCRTYWPSPFRVCGAIREKYEQLGGPRSFLTWPKSDELGVPDGVGRRSEFVNGFIYWHPDTGAHAVTTHFSVVWARNGWEAGRMGYPVSDEYGLGDGVGRRQDFQRAHVFGSLAGLASVEGRIFDRWVELGGESGQMLGYPVEDEKPTPDGIGRYSRFVWGFIYWTPETGAHPVYGPILAQWAAGGYEKGPYGYPISDIQGDPNGADSQVFQRGNIKIPGIPSPTYTELSEYIPAGEQFRTPGEFKVIGDNYDRIFECWGEKDRRVLTIFHRTGERLDCGGFYHISQKHMPDEKFITRQIWEDFQTCVAYTLFSREPSDRESQRGTYIRTRFNTYSKVRSYVIVWSDTKLIRTAFTEDDRKGRDWGGCRKGLIR